MTEDRTFVQILLKLDAIYPNRKKELSKSVVYSGKDLSISYSLSVHGKFIHRFYSFQGLINYASDIIAEHDNIFARRRMIHNRDWDKLYGEGG